MQSGEQRLIWERFEVLPRDKQREVSDFIEFKGTTDSEIVSCGISTTGETVKSLEAGRIGANIKIPKMVAKRTVVNIQKFPLLETLGDILYK